MPLGLFGCAANLIAAITLGTGSSPINSRSIAIFILTNGECKHVLQPNMMKCDLSSQVINERQA